jgi:plastocyanin
VNWPAGRIMATVIAVPPGVRRAGCALIALLGVAAVAPTAASAALPARGLGKAVAVQSLAGGAKRLTYRVGPFDVIPGQNSIDLTPIIERPQVDGYITRMRPDLTYLNGTVPRVDVIHLHHGVWLNLSRSDATVPGLPERFFAAGEEKTRVIFPKGYGYPLKASDRLLLNEMIHNLTPIPTKVYMVWKIDFAPKGSAAARHLRAVRPIWMDVRNGQVYPVFNVRKGSGHKGRYTYPRDARNPYGAGPKRNQWVVDKPGVLVATAGHLHPGGLYTDLKVRRRGKTAELFRSRAKYFEPAGAVSWDVAMTGTPRNWKVKLRRGDVLSTSATYDTRRASWWESMGIMVAWMADGGPGKNPFKTKVARPGRPTHGHLRENRNHGGKPGVLPDARTLPDGADNPGFVDLVDFKYQLGDLSLGGQAGNPPVIHAGQALTFRDAGDNARGVYHSITSCKAPCNRTTGIAYPIADGNVQFESGTLGTQSPPATGALQWTTPRNLKPGTYTYFCRIHPFMRGSFRVEP